MRLLALWHARRRDLDELLEPLLAQGPLAVERVATHLGPVTAAVAGERAAYDAFLQAAASRAAEDARRAGPGGPVPDERFVRAREQALVSGHPSGGTGPARDDVVVELAGWAPDDSSG